MQPLSQDAISTTTQDETMASLTVGIAAYKGPELYEFLVESELQHYYNALTKDLKVNTVPQLKYVEEDDMRQIGMSKPEMRRLKKYFYKYCPQTYLRRIKKIILNKKEDNGRTAPAVPDPMSDKPNLKFPCKHMISADSISVNKELGSGEFGIVQQGVWTNEEGIRIQVAIKRLSKEKMQNNSMDFLKEASIMHSIDNNHIVRLYGVVLEADALMLVTELAPLRSLLECLKEPALRPSFPVISLCEFALQICDGMQYLESKRLIHRDLAARNILVFSKNKVKISDFGLSRALGVGKNYYQTNFNVNLKLPIAWCAPECINYLRFTSASDVWAYGVTLWEMFSYGFQPWAALTGQQILEAIDEPNLHRLEQPDCCPKEYYALMLKCWQHDPNKRPKFAEILSSLPESKPEQVLTIKDFEEATSGSHKFRRDFLMYKANEVITVLDKKPLPDNPVLWKGVLNNGKTGIFNPANTVAYLGTDIPSMKPSFMRSDGKSGLYSSRRRLRPDMISRPQGDFKHTGHVGLDGAFFGDVSFLGDKYGQLPKQVVAPYKPQEDQDGALMRNVSDASDRAPLIDGEKSGTTTNLHWPDEKSGKPSGATSARRTSESPSSCGLTDHEYHEISDDDENGGVSKSPDSPESYLRNLGLGSSLVDEVFQALNSGRVELDEATPDETANTRNEIKEMTIKVESSLNGSHKDVLKKKHGSSVKPISPSDAKVMESAIVFATELATRNMLEMDSRSESDTAQDSPRTPSSPNKRKFSFRFATVKGGSSSPRTEKRNFTEEAASIPNIQETLTESAKEAYNSLVEGKRNESATSPVEEETNPLRMLRNGIPVRPKVRGNKHGGARSAGVGLPGPDGPQHSHQTHHHHHSHHHNHHHQNHAHSQAPAQGVLSQSQSMENVPLLTNSQSSSSVGNTSTSGSVISSTLPRSSIIRNSVSQNGTSPPASGISCGTWSGTTSPRSPTTDSGPLSPVTPLTGLSDSETGTTTGNSTSSIVVMGSPPNLLPLPPRDRTKPVANHKPRQRKHPLIIPTGNTRNLMKPSLSSSISDVDLASSRPEMSSTSDLSTVSPLSPSDINGPLSPIDFPQIYSSAKHDAFQDSRTAARDTVSVTSVPVKPPRLNGLDDSFDGQIQADIDSLDDIPEEEAPVPPMYRNSDHVSCEDLLDFACDLPNTKRTQGRARGIDSDEVRVMRKVFKGGVTPGACIGALDETDWDVHKAIKYLKLQMMLVSHLISLDNCKQTLMSCSWDVQKAYNYLMATYGIVEDSTEV